MSADNPNAPDSLEITLRSIGRKASCRFMMRLGVVALTFWFMTVDTSMAEWGTDVPVNHPRFCEKQEIRVSKIADFLTGFIMKRAIDTSTSGYILSSH